MINLDTVGDRLVLLVTLVGLVAIACGWIN